MTAYYTNNAVQNKATLVAGRQRDMSKLLQLITKPYPDYLPNPDHQKPLVVLWYYQKDVMLRNGNFRKKSFAPQPAANFLACASRRAH